MFRKIARVVLNGLITVLPLAVTVYAVYWLAVTLETLFAAIIRFAGGERIYRPGMGIVLGLAAVIAIGIAANFYIAQALLRLGDRILERIPVAKTIYGAVKDLMQLFSGDPKKGFSDVVLVDVGGTGQKILGMITRDGFEELPETVRGNIGVYLPMSYQLGGFLVMVPRESVEKVDMTIEQAMKFAMTAGVSAPPRENRATQAAQTGGLAEPAP